MTTWHNVGHLAPARKIHQNWSRVLHVLVTHGYIADRIEHILRLANPPSSLEIYLQNYSEKSLHHRGNCHPSQLLPPNNDIFHHPQPKSR